MQNKAKALVTDYHSFTTKLLISSCCAVILSGGINSFLVGLIASVAPLFPSWIFSLVQIVGASAALWWVNRNGDKKVKK